MRAGGSGPERRCVAVDETPIPGMTVESVSPTRFIKGQTVICMSTSRKEFLFSSASVFMGDNEK